MKNLTSLAMLSLLVISCAVTRKKSKDVSDIKQEDFKKVTSVKYQEKDDRFEQVKSDYSAVSNSESLQRVFLYDGDISLEGDLGRVAKLCYEEKFPTANDLIKSLNSKYLKNPIFWNQVGTCYLLQKSRRKALLFYNKALALKANYAPALNNLGVMYSHEGDYSRALLAFEKAKKAKTFSRTPRLNLANIYVSFGLYKRALKELDTLYSLSSLDIDVLNLKATAHLMNNEVQKSIEIFSKIDRDFLEEPRFGLNYALALNMAGKKNDSHNIFNDVDIKNHHNWKQYYKRVKKYIGAK